MNAIHRICVVAPMLNEAAHVEHLVADLAAQDFDGRVTMVFADGGSTDGCVEQLKRGADGAGLDVQVVPNPKRWAGPGLNAALQRVEACDLIVRIDCHSRYSPDYLRRCAEASEQTGAWNVGGAFTAVGTTPMERAVACAYNSPFGGVSWTRHQRGAKRVDADIVYYGAFKPEVFRELGLYDENLGTAELEDLCRRIRDAGQRVVFDPSIKIFYTPRGSFRALIKQYYRYGLWKLAVMFKYRKPLSGRSVVPFVFVLVLAGLGVAAIFSARARLALALVIGVYLTVSVVFAVAAVRGRGESLTLLPRVVGSLATFHFAHGLGQLHGWLRVVRRLGKPHPPVPSLVPERGEHRLKI